MSDFDIFISKYRQNFLIKDIKEYNFVEEIGEGSFGTIHKVKYNDKFYAAKVAKKKPKDSEKCYREIDILMKFRHPTIINFYGYSLKDQNDKENLIIIMQLAKNGSLYDFLNKFRKNQNDSNIFKKYDNTARQIILIGIARGMMILHQHNSIHRDLKPQNVLLDDNLYPLITDFGLSKQFDYDESMEQSISESTPKYMAPEMLSGIDKIKFNRKVDVYSFGIIMYEVVTNLAPFSFNQKIPRTAFEVMDFVKKGERPQFDPKNPIKKSIQNLIEQCWDQEATKRPSFEAIYKKLAFNLKDSCNPNSIDNFFCSKSCLNSTLSNSESTNNNSESTNNNSESTNNNSESTNNNSESTNNNSESTNNNSESTNNNSESTNNNSESTNNNSDDDYDYFLDGIDYKRVYNYLKIIDKNTYTNIHIQNSQ